MSAHEGREGGQPKVDKCGQGEGVGGWLAKCGRPLRKKIIAAIFKFTQIIWQYVCIYNFHFMSQGLKN